MKTAYILFIIVIVIVSAANQNVFAQQNTNNQATQISAAEGNRYWLVSDMTNIASSALEYFRKPKSMGGGDNFFSGWFIPKVLGNTRNGMYTAIVTTKRITLAGTGKVIGHDGMNKIKITMDISPNRIESITVNN
jgi:hypothetical protein